MGKLKLEAQKEFEQAQKQGQEIVESAEQKLEEAWLSTLPLGYEGISIIDDIEAIDDDDLAAIEAAQKEANDIAANLRFEIPTHDIDPLPGHTMDEFLSDYSASDAFFELSPNEDRPFQEIVEEHEQVDPELQAKFDQIVTELEGIF